MSYQTQSLMRHIQFIIDNARPLQSEPDKYFTRRIPNRDMESHLRELGIIGGRKRIPKSEYFGCGNWYTSIYPVDLEMATYYLEILKKRQRGKRYIVNLNGI